MEPYYDQGWSIGLSEKFCQPLTSTRLCFHLVLYQLAQNSDICIWRPSAEGTAASLKPCLPSRWIPQMWLGLALQPWLGLEVDRSEDGGGSFQLLLFVFHSLWLIAALHFCSKHLAYLKATFMKSNSNLKKNNLIHLQIVRAKCFVLTSPFSHYILIGFYQTKFKYTLTVYTHIYIHITHVEPLIFLCIINSVQSLKWQDRTINVAVPSAGLYSPVFQKGICLQHIF